MIAQLLCPKQERWDTILDFSAESIRFIGYPVSVFLRVKSKSIRSHKSLHSASLLDLDTPRIKENIAAFNVVLAFDIDCQLLANVESIKEAVIAISN